MTEYISLNPEWRAVKIDVSQYCEPEFLARCGGKVYQVSLYDSTARTFCCEITPSFCLIPVDLVPETYPETDDAREDLACELLDALNECCECFYVHCSTVERMESLPVPVDIDTDDLPEDGGEADAIEAYHSSPLF